MQASNIPAIHAGMNSVFRLANSSRLERQRHAVQTVPFSGGLWPIVEDMAQMPTTAAAMDFGADKQQFAVTFGGHGIWQAFPKARSQPAQ